MSKTLFCVKAYPVQEEIEGRSIKNTLQNLRLKHSYKSMRREKTKQSRYNHFHTPNYALIYILSITKTLCSFASSYMFRHTACHHQGAPLSWLKSLIKNIRS
jgi:hypothetical protein